MMSLPLYPGVTPYEQVLTQFSIHRFSAPGQIDVHSDYLADHASDCRWEFAERLIVELGEQGSIPVYSQFELMRINELARFFSDFRGSFSIKSVLPTLVPELTNDGLAIGDGDAAIA